MEKLSEFKVNGTGKTFSSTALMLVVGLAGVFWVTVVLAGEPIPGVDVKLGKNPPKTGSVSVVRTDKNGAFEFKNLPKGNYTLSSPGLPDKSLTVGSGGEVGGKLNPDGFFDVFVGRTNTPPKGGNEGPDGLAMEGQPIPGVDVELGKNPPKTGSVLVVRTDKNGTFEFKNLPEGNYTLSSPGLPDKSLTVGSGGEVGGKLTPDGFFDVFVDRTNTPPKGGDGGSGKLANQPVDDANSTLWSVSTTRGRVEKPQDASEPGIFDRWGKSSDHSGGGGGSGELANQAIGEANSVMNDVSTTRGRVEKPQDASQPGIFDRWGKSSTQKGDNEQPSVGGSGPAGFGTGMNGSPGSGPALGGMGGMNPMMGPGGAAGPGSPMMGGAMGGRP